MKRKENKEGMKEIGRLSEKRQIKTHSKENAKKN